MARRENKHEGEEGRGGGGSARTQGQKGRRRTGCSRIFMYASSASRSAAICCWLRFKYTGTLP